jgi:alginate O-acetyltransferase complex protein AlgI
MLFNSVEFLLFYVAVLAVYYGLAPTRAWGLRKLVLLLASCLFYMSWSPAFILLLLLIAALCFAAVLGMAAATDPRWKRAWLALGVGTSLAILGYFKYRGFVLENLSLLGTKLDPRFSQVILPLGISFYTFHAISYMVDVYRGRVAPHRNFLDVALYIAFFPQLVAGPIMRASVFLPQLARAPQLSGPAAERALMLIALGLFKKVVGADVLGEYVDQVFRDVAGHHGVNLAVAIYAYAFQIYFDFSGYSDMALGLAALLGFQLPVNFRLPYAAQNPSELWQRWHISLSTWLRDYLYIPLGGNRRGTGRTYANLMITMVLGGLWHGAAWNFVAWGTYHGALLALHRWWGRDSPSDGGWRVVARRLGMFHLTCVGWVLFRAESAADIFRYFHGLVQPGVVVTPAFTRAVWWSALAFVVHQLCADRDLGQRFLRMPPGVQAATYAAMAVLVFLFSPGTQRFIYFQF